MLHYLRLIKLFIQTAVQQEMASRANFLINLLNTALNLIAGIAGIAILFSQVETIQGWTFSQALALLGTYLLVSALQNVCIGPSMDSLGGLYGDVLSGRFDFTLLKPVHTQFLVSFRNWRPWAFSDLILSLVVLGVALVKLGEQLSLLSVVTFVVALGVSITIVYAILLLLASGIFWYQGVPLLWIFGYLMQMGRYPVEIYPGWLRLVLTWIVPIGFITTVPAGALAGQVPTATLLSGIALAVGLLVLASVLFRGSLRRYVGASS